MQNENYRLLQNSPVTKNTESVAFSVWIITLTPTRIVETFLHIDYHKSVLVRDHLSSLTDCFHQMIFSGMSLRCYEQDDTFTDKTVEFHMNDSRFDGSRDAVDDKLVMLLCQNARMSLTALAKAAGLSRTAVQARIARLERSGVIAGYRAILGTGAVQSSVGAVLLITFSQRPCTPVVAKFRHWPEIEAYYSVTGPVDAFVVVKVATTQTLSSIVNNLSALPGVASVQSSVIL